MALILNSGGNKIDAITPIVITNDTKIENAVIGKYYAVGGAWDNNNPTIASGASDVNVSQTVSLGSGYFSGVMTLKATATTVNFGGHFFGAYCQLD